jgi:hypothetical protein
MKDGFRGQDDGVARRWRLGTEHFEVVGVLLNRTHDQDPLEGKMKYGLLWLLGVPIPILILLYFIF